VGFTTNKDLANRFNYHKPTDDKIIAHSDIREAAFTFATVLNNLLPEGREKASALTKIEEAMFWGNAGIARSDGKPALPAT
jgi:hypothetical protein